MLLRKGNHFGLFVFSARHILSLEEPVSYLLSGLIVMHSGFKAGSLFISFT